MQLLTIEAPSGLKIYHKGPSLDQGALPTLFYFAISGQDSLLLDPYNQLISSMDLSKIRAISFDLPAHEGGADPQKAVSVWAKELKSSPKYIDNFLELCLQNIDYLIENKICDPKHIATAGLSRGGLIAAHIAARQPYIHNLLGFAPLTTFKQLHEFENAELASLNLEFIIPKLIHKQVRFYVGNRDTRVGTESCFRFVHNLTEQAYTQGVRSPQVELILFPSIGHKGHGTPLNIFQDGARWISSKLV